MSIAYPDKSLKLVQMKGCVSVWMIYSRGNGQEMVHYFNGPPKRATFDHEYLSGKLREHISEEEAKFITSEYNEQMRCLK